ncbi:MAG: MBL fold metallo-hydrolase [Bacteroidia bacterium]|nr:MBL fold metallo-hydrolase [Bacteroidia bacterium]
MINIKSFTFGPFQENTYVLYNETNECAIVDPGCYDDDERRELEKFISEKKLSAKLLLNTHGHIDHIVGNKFVFEKYGLQPLINANDLPALNSLETIAKLYGLNAEASPEPAGNLNEGDVVKIGHSALEVLFTPGHSPGSVCFVSHSQKFIIGGDVLFYGSIGRTDLPGGNHQILINSITTKLMVLADDFSVYSGHGPVTTIGFERNNNPFL